jgi:hypothetical protein
MVAEAQHRPASSRVQAVAAHAADWRWTRPQRKHHAVAGCARTGHVSRSSWYERRSARRCGERRFQGRHKNLIFKRGGSNRAARFLSHRPCSWRGIALARIASGQARHRRGPHAQNIAKDRARVGRRCRAEAGGSQLSAIRPGRCLRLMRGHLLPTPACGQSPEKRSARTAISGAPASGISTGTYRPNNARG